LIALRRAIIWILGSLSVATLAASMLQLRMSSPVGVLLQQYDQAIQRAASLLQSLAVPVQHQLAAVVGSNPSLYPHWPHLFLVFALQFLPRAEPFPGWNNGSEQLVKVLQGLSGIAAALVIALCIGSAPTLFGEFAPQFFLFAAAMTFYIQARAANWPIHVGTLDSEGMLPAFAPPPGDEPDEASHWSFQAIFAATGTIAFALAFLAVEGGLIPEDIIVRSTAKVGIAVCTVLWVAWCLSMYVPGVDVGLERLLGNPGDVGAARLSALSRLSLLAAAAGLCFLSFTTELHHPAPGFLIDCALALLAMIFAYTGQRIHLRLVPPHLPDRDYPFPSATGIFLVGAALLFVIDNLLR
jgi:hypothetical protein